MLAYSNHRQRFFKKHRTKFSGEFLEFVDYKPKEPELSVVNKISKTLELVQKGRMDKFNDYIFDCCLNELFNRLVKFESNSYTDTFIHALDICSHTVTSPDDIRTEQRILANSQGERVVDLGQPSAGCARSDEVGQL
jgi:hypothetical protein